MINLKGVRAGYNGVGSFQVGKGRRSTLQCSWPRIRTISS